MNSLNLREKFAGFVLIAIGSIYLILFLISFAGNQANMVNVDEKDIRINRYELLGYIRSMLIIFYTILGAVLLFRVRKAGWIFSLAILPVFLIMLGGGWYQLIQLELIDFTLIFLILGTVIMVLTVLFLLLPSCRRKLGLQKRDYSITLVLAVVNLVVFFLL